VGDRTNTVGQEEYDIGIVGAGPVGLLAGIALAQTGAKVAMWDPKKALAVAHSAPITLRLSSKRLLEKLGVWARIKTKPVAVRALHIAHTQYFGSVHFSDQEYGGEALAYVVDSRQLAEALYETSQTQPIAHYEDSIVARMICTQRGYRCEYHQSGLLGKARVKRVVVCDGAQSMLSEQLGVEKVCVSGSFSSHVYKVVADVWPQGEAWQLFDSHGVVGLIPGLEANTGTLVVTSATEEELILAPVLARLQSRIGAIKACEKAGQYASLLQMRKTPPTHGIVVLGNARLSMPPLGAQALNIAVSEIDALIRLHARTAWHEAPIEDWQACWAAESDKHATSRLQLMQRVWEFHGAQEGCQQLLSRVGWSWLGLDAAMQATILAEGQGQRWTQ
jgi:2-polyprenyl-6-methoxyphenol hydroxylase-like FAD-dependent oxidoreductase